MAALELASSSAGSDSLLRSSLRVCAVPVPHIIVCILPAPKTLWSAAMLQTKDISTAMAAQIKRKSPPDFRPL